MQLTNSNMLRDAIRSFKDDLVVMVNERSGYANEYSILAKLDDPIGLVQRQQRIIKLQTLIKASSEAIGNLDMYIKAAVALVKWIDGNYTGVHLPQMQVSASQAIQLVLNSVGLSPNQLARDESKFVVVRTWADLYEVSQTLLIEA